MNAKVLWGLFVVVAAGAVAALVGWWNARETHRRVPDFRLVERSGEPLTRRDLVGEVWVTGFVFTRCSGTCPVMINRVWKLKGEFPDARYVLFTCDPEYDTPEVLAAFADRMRTPREQVLFATDTSERRYEAMQELAKKGFLLGGGTSDEKIIHSPYLVIVDRYGRWRFAADVTDPDGFARLRAELGRVLAEPAIPIARLPAVNAGLNSLAGVLLIAGFVMVRSGRVGLHKTFMLAALVTSALFLASYLTYHHYAGSKGYTGEGAIRTVYFAILISHTVLAALIVPLAGITVTLAFMGRLERHKRVARWTLPLWLYVSVTGVVIYFMLYGR